MSDKDVSSTVVTLLVTAMVWALLTLAFAADRSRTMDVASYVVMTGLLVYTAADKISHKRR